MVPQTEAEITTTHSNTVSANIRRSFLRKLIASPPQSTRQRDSPPRPAQAASCARERPPRSPPAAEITESPYVRPADYAPRNRDRPQSCRAEVVAASLARAPPR